MGYLRNKDETAKRRIATRPGPNGSPEPAWKRAPERLRQSTVNRRNSEVRAP